MEVKLNIENFNIGTDAFKKGDYIESIKYFTIAIEDNKFFSFSQAYLWRGISLYFVSQFEQAIEDFNEASLGIQNEIRIFNWRGLSYKNLGLYKEAISDFKSAIEIDEKFRDAYVELYEIGIDMNDYDLFNTYFHKLIDLNRENINLLILRADSVMKKSEFDLSIKMCDFILSKIHNEKNSIQIRATSNANLLNYGLALKDFDKFIQLDPNNAIGYYNRALVHKELKNQQANEDFRKSYSLGCELAKEHI